jgi:hypothetical protein
MRKQEKAKFLFKQTKKAPQKSGATISLMKESPRKVDSRTATRKVLFQDIIISRR